MANVENRAAEHGSEIISDTALHSWSTGRQPAAIRVLEDTTFTILTSPNCVNIAYYVTNGAVEDKTILANIGTLQLGGGAVQVVFS